MYVVHPVTYTLSKTLIYKGHKPKLQGKRLATGKVHIQLFIVLGKGYS